MTVIKEHSDAYYRRINTGSAIAVPILILATAGYSIWVVVELLCINILINTRKDRAAAIVLLVFYFLFFILAWGHYTRLLIATYQNNDAIPRPIDFDSKTDYTFNSASIADGTLPPPPGLSAFFHHDSYSCDQYGLPHYCPDCKIWKPSRTHHNRDMGRCFRRMDHFCPWVGGMVAESNMKFFLQFSFWAAVFCTFTVGIVAWGLKLAIEGVTFREERDNFIAIIVVGSFFVIMAGTTFLNWLRLCILNLTTVDNLQRTNFGRDRFYAVRVPEVGRDGNELALRFPTITYPLPTKYEGDGQTDRSFTGESHSGPMATNPRQSYTFAIIRLEPGSNPWNLGSATKNLRTIFGSSLLTALSPFRTRTYEGADYPIGPSVQRQIAQGPKEAIPNAGNISETSSSTSAGVQPKG